MNKCEICGSFGGLEKHRIIPGKAGGEYKDKNVIYLCKDHHVKIHVLIRKKLGIDYYDWEPTLEDFLNIVLELQQNERNPTLGLTISNPPVKSLRYHDYIIKSENRAKTDDRPKSGGANPRRTKDLRKA